MNKVKRARDDSVRFETDRVVFNCKKVLDGLVNRDSQ